MNDRNAIPELPFRPDFAARVLAEADGFVARRRKWKISGAAVGAIGAMLLGLWSVSPSRNTRPELTASAWQPGETGEFGWPEEARFRDPLQWMFPDAQPVAQFADLYSNASNGGVRQRQQMLFADAAGESGAP